MDTKVTIGAASELTGVSTRAIRLYERRGLTRPAERTPAGYRLYGPDDLGVLDFVRRARTLGLRLDEIGEILDVQRDGGRTCSAVMDLLDQRLGEIDDKIDDLRVLRDTIRTTRNRAPQNVKEAAICGLIQPDEL